MRYNWTDEVNRVIITGNSKCTFCGSKQQLHAEMPDGSKVVRCPSCGRKRRPSKSKDMGVRLRRQLQKMIVSNVYRTMSDARIATHTSYDDTLLSRLDRIESYAYAAVVYIIARAK